MTLPQRNQSKSRPSPVAEASAAHPVELVAAIAANGVIGAGNTLPWRLPQDLRRFRALTMDHAIIMGRRTWQSLPHALPGRQNIVVTRDPALRAEGAVFAPSLDAALATVALPGPAFVIGGAELYALALPAAARLHLTEILADFDGDTWFPPWPRDAWREAAREEHRAEPGVPAFAFVTYERAG